MKSKTKLKIQELRSFSKDEASVKDCQNALRAAEGDLDKAKAILTTGDFGDYFITPRDAPEGWSVIMREVVCYRDSNVGTGRINNDSPDREIENSETEIGVNDFICQLSEGKGYRPDNPIVGISISAAYAAIALLQCVVRMQMAIVPDNPTASLSVIDFLSIEHRPSGNGLGMFVAHG